MHLNVPIVITSWFTYQAGKRFPSRIVVITFLALLSCNFIQLNVTLIHH